MKRILILVENLYEDLELWYPKIRMEEAGHHCIVAGPKADEMYKGKHGYPCRSHIEFDEVEAEDFDALIIPGGYAPDLLRRVPKVLEVTKNFDLQKKCIAFICHAGWVPISANIVKGKNVTSFFAIKDDMKNAGAIWHDQAVVVDRHLISSRTPADLGAFCLAIMDVLEKQKSDAT
jgi:protease I